MLDECRYISTLKIVQIILAGQILEDASKFVDYKSSTVLVISTPFFAVFKAQSCS